MRTRLLLTLLVATAFACSLHPAPAQAQRVFVSATGSDGNPCTFASPCRSFQHAHNTTGAGGEIDVLDPAGYGALTITKAISIQGHGFSGITVASGANGITINAGPSDAVTLNGLLIDGAGAGYNGVVFNSGGSLTVTNCVAQNFFYNGISLTTGNGILIQPTSGTVNVVVTNTIASNNAIGGIYYLPPSGSPTVKMVVDHVVAASNENGLSFDGIHTSGGAADIAVSSSIASNNSGGGIFAGNGTALTISIDSVTVTGNDIGISAGSPAKVLLGRSVIQGNSIGIGNSTSNAFYTYRDNRINLNTSSDISSTLNTSFTQQ